jgi:hypothetical protein
MSLICRSLAARARFDHFVEGNSTIWSNQDSEYFFIL